MPDNPSSSRCVDEPRETCTETGVLAPLLGIIGSIQAAETIKLLLDAGEVLAGRLLLLDAVRMQWRSLKLRKDPACPVCSQAAFLTTRI